MTTKGRGPSSPINGIAPAALTANQVVNLGALVAVVIGDAASGAQVALATEGVFSLAKATGFSLAAGDPVYFDTGTDQRAEDDQSLPCIGYATEAAGSSATSVTLRLTPVVSPTGGSAKLNNLNASARPTVDDDGTEGYSIGSEWQYQGVRWICIGVGTGAAKWRALNTLGVALTIASGAVTGSVALPTGAANGDYVVAIQTADMTNEVAVSRAIATGGNAVVHLTGDPGASGATLNLRILPADVG